MLFFELKVGKYIVIDVSLIAVDDCIFAGDDFGDIGLQSLRIMTVVDRILLGREGILNFQVSLRLAIIQQSIHLRNYKYQTILLSDLSFNNH